MLFSVELGVSNCSWKQKAPSCSNEIKTIDVTFPDSPGNTTPVHFANMSSEYLPRSRKSYSNFKAVSSSFFSAHLWLFFSHNELKWPHVDAKYLLNFLHFLFFFFKVYSVLFELLLTCCTFWWPKAWSSQCVTRVFTLDLSANSGHMHLC